MAIPFLTDQCVPDSVGNVIVDSGHALTRLRDVMSIRTPDPLVAIACAQSGHVFVTHDRDFRNGARRLKITKRQYQSSLHRIQLCCPEPEAAGRLKLAMSIIELEWAQLADGGVMVIQVRDSSIVVER